MSEEDRRREWNANAAAWTELSRAGFDVYRDLVNTPAFFSVLPPVEGLVCLDLGCGEGHNTRLVAARGAWVVGVDLADRFVAAAVEEGSPSIRYLVGDGSVLPFPASSFDVVTAFMSLMDVGSPEVTLVEVARVLRPGGFVQFSISHPATSTPTRFWVNDADGVRHALATAGYFQEGPVTESWIAPFQITYARRTLTGWVDAVLAAGLVLEAVAEPHADDTTAATHPEVADTQIAPYFLIFRARKP
jgi:ubiquinone/menaquinone biosynthesis C-methylase UbiE